jgi:tetratricopeptide (TPR) repeat protein
MEQSLSDEFLSQLVVGYIKIQKEKFSEASDHFNKMLYSSHNPNDDDILWIAKAHIYRKIGKEEESKTCIDMVLGAFGNPKILEYNLGR